MGEILYRHSSFPDFESNAATTSSFPSVKAVTAFPSAIDIPEYPEPPLARQETASSADSGVKLVLLVVPSKFGPRKPGQSSTAYAGYKQTRNRNKHKIPFNVMGRFLRRCIPEQYKIFFTAGINLDT